LKAAQKQTVHGAESEKVCANVLLASQASSVCA
jgi:hypothetical protein